MEQKTAGLPKDDAFDMPKICWSAIKRRTVSIRKNVKRCIAIIIMVCGLIGITIELTSCGKEDVPVQVQFKPVITAIGAHRSGSAVTFTATVSDAGPAGALRYRWRFDGGLAFVDSTANPAVLQGYDESRSGNLTLTVTNGAGGATTVTYYIAPGLLPDDVVVVVARLGDLDGAMVWP